MGIVQTLYIIVDEVVNGIGTRRAGALFSSSEAKSFALVTGSKTRLSRPFSG